MWAYYRVFGVLHILYGEIYTLSKLMGLLPSIPCLSRFKLRNMHFEQAHGHVIEFPAKDFTGIYNEVYFYRSQ